MAKSKFIESGTFDTADLEPGLSPELEAALLRVVLIWATLDGAVSQLYVALHGLNDIESADEVSDQPTTWKLRQIQLKMRQPAPELAKAIGRLKKQYENYSVCRNTIAHCHCAGHLVSEPQRAVFMRYRRSAAGLIVDAFHVDQFKQAARFGEHLAAVVRKLDERIREAISQN